MKMRAKNSIVLVSVHERYSAFAIMNISPSSEAANNFSAYFLSEISGKSLSGLLILTSEDAWKLINVVTNINTIVWSTSKWVSDAKYGNVNAISGHMIVRA